MIEIKGLLLVLNSAGAGYLIEDDLPSQRVPTH
jgi:hypothetical protein